MAKDWEKLAGEKGERVSTNRFQRALKLGSMGAKVGASSLAGRMKSMLSGSSEDEIKEMFKKNAGQMAEVLGELKGASMKVGQMLSADPEMLPEGFAEGLESLQRDAPPMTWNTVKDQIETSLDRPMETVFSWFDPEPVGAASIGQVHRARLDTGEDVAVKVQYPGVADALESDMETLKQMLIWGRPFIERERLDLYFQEIHDVLMTEADYVQEAQQANKFRGYFKDKLDEFYVPKAYEEYTAKQVLVMEFVEGDKLDVAIEKMPKAERDEMLQRWLEVFVWMFHELQVLHSDPHPGNFLIDSSNRMVLLDFGCVKSFEAEFTDGILELLDTLWADDPERALDIYERIGFGGAKFHREEFNPELVTQYHEIVLAPFLRDEPFEFKGWTPAIESKMFMLKHPSFLTLTPPPHALAYFRVLSGIKGLLGRFEARINTFEAAVKTAERRGVLTAF